MTALWCTALTGRDFFENIFFSIFLTIYKQNSSDRIQPERTKFDKQNVSLNYGQVHTFNIAMSSKASFLYIASLLYNVTF